jgi:cyclophilin family peptidyl-prolyl cis-trans isomerase
MFYRTSMSLASVLAAAALPLKAAAPVFPDAPGGNDFPTTFPCGKTLVIPLVADDPDGDSLSYTVTSSSPLVMARVRSGNFHYKVHVHSDNNGQNVPVDGDMEFQLFRNATPETAAFIAGYAQSGYYDDVLFHRVIPNFVIQGGDKAGTGGGPSPYTIRHEFRPELIYTGRGQLAMANSGGGYQQTFPNNGNFRYHTGSFNATNGSQFFVTLGQPRHLDFKHTLFGQLVRGFPTLDQISGVKTNADGTVGTSDDDRPATPVKMTTHSVTASRTDAVLLLSAKTTGQATVTVTARDPGGAVATKSFVVNVVVDDTNDPPMLLPFEPAVAPVGGFPNLRIQSFDLEHDAISTRFPVQDVFSSSSIIYAGVNGANLGAVAPPSAGAWDVTFGVSGLNDPLLDVDPFSASRFEKLEIGLGDKALIAQPRTIEAEAGASTGSVVLATFRHGSAAAAPSDYIALVKWGDGTDPQSTGGTAPITIVRSATEPGAFEVRGQHTYARPGVYPVHVTLDAPLGATDTARGWAAVSPQGAVLRAAGEEIAVRGAVFARRPVAYFRDSTPGARPRDYSIVIDWGDGQRTPGSVRQVAADRFAVFGTHRYLDAESFSTAIHIRREGSNEEAIAWGRIEMTGFRGPEHLPPFSKANITSLWSEAPTKIYRGAATDLVGTLFLINGGDKETGKWKLRFWISNDNTLDPTIDKRVKVGPLARQLPEIALNSLPPGGGGNLGLKPFQGGDFTLRLPAGETGAGKYVIAELVYSDPITDHMKVPKIVPFGPLTGILTRKPANFSIREDGANNQGTTTFFVKLDTLPTSNVTIPLDITMNGAVNTSRAVLDKQELVFTPANGTTEQAVTVTAKDDGLQNSTNTLVVRLKPATSTDPRFSGMDATDLNLPIADFPRNVVVTPTSLTVKEGSTVKTFTVRLQSQPDAAVVVPLEIVDANGNPNTSRATLDKAMLNFSTTNGTTAQTVTVTAVNDELDNGDANFTIRVKPALSSSSSDESYNGRDGADIALVVQDNDTIGVQVSATSLPLQEAGAAVTFTVRLQTRPTSEVTIPLEVVNANGDPDQSRMTINVSQLVFTPDNATTAQTITITPINDADVNGTGTFKIRLSPAVEADQNAADYHGVNGDDVTVTITDDESAAAPAAQMEADGGQI